MISANITAVAASILSSVAIPSSVLVLYWLNVEATLVPPRSPTFVVNCPSTYPVVATSAFTNVVSELTAVALARVSNAHFGVDPPRLLGGKFPILLSTSDLYSFFTPVAVV